MKKKSLKDLLSLATLGDLKSFVTEIRHGEIYETENRLARENGTESCNNCQE